MLDQDTAQQAALHLTINGNSTTPIGAAGAATVSFTATGLDPEDTGTVAFTDGNGKTVQVDVNGAQTSYTANLTSLADGTITSSLSVNTDPAGNTFSPAPGNALTLRQTPPTVQVSIDHSDVNIATQTALVTFAFNEPINDFTILGSTTVTGGALSNLQTTDGGKTYTATFTPTANTDISNASVGVIAGSYHDLAGNAGTGGSTPLFTVDSATPTVTVTTSNNAVNLANNTATVTFSLSEAPTSFVLADTAATGGTLSNLVKVDPTHYTATFTAAANTLINNASVSVTGGSWTENNGNPGAGGATANFTVDTFDHWINSAGGDWVTAANWGNGVPTANLAADIDASGTYTVTISSADTTYGLLINAAGATVSDNTGGSLSITNSGGPSNPNGAVIINAGSFALAGGDLTAGSISIANSGALLVSQSYTGTSALAESITNNGSITISNSSIVTFNGAISGSGSVTVQNSAKAIFNTALTGTGSFTLQDSGSLEFGAADSENVTFAAGASGTLKIDQSLTAPFTGSISGLTTTDSVDLVDLAWTHPSKSMTATYSGTASGGTLTVSNRTNSVTLNLLGDYRTASWLLSKDGTGGTLVADPPIRGSLTPDADHATASGIDLSEISFGANTRLAYAANSDNTGGTLTVSDGLHARSLALLGQYMASSLPMASDGHGGTLITDPALTQHSQLTLPRA
jgi:hypothetical protein